MPEDLYAQAQRSAERVEETGVLAEAGLLGLQGR